MKESMFAQDLLFMWETLDQIVDYIQAFLLDLYQNYTKYGGI